MPLPDRMRRWHRPQTYAEWVLSTPSLFAYWRLGEPSGTLARDEIGAHDGTYLNSPTLGVAGLLTGDSDTAATFNGSNYASLPLPALTAFSVAVWIRTPDQTDNTRAIQNNWSTPGGWVLFIGQTPGSVMPHFYINNGGVEVQGTFSIAKAWDANAHLIVGVYDGVNVRVYWDGEVGDISPVSIGCSGGPLTAQVGFVSVATLDEPAIWSRALTAAEIGTLWAAGAGRG